MHDSFLHKYPQLAPYVPPPVFWSKYAEAHVKASQKAEKALKRADRTLLTELTRLTIGRVYIISVDEAMRDLRIYAHPEQTSSVKVLKEIVKDLSAATAYIEEFKKNLSSLV